jgi:putative endopeptidase
MRPAILCSALITLLSVSFSQTASVGSNVPMPKLNRFSVDQADPSVDPCSDFFHYACGKWIKANPIPPDQGGSGSFLNLLLWNVAAIHNILEDAAQTSTSRTPNQQKIGDYYAACMDEATVNRKGLTPLKPELDRIAKLTDKSQIPEVLASIHQMIRPANLNNTDAQYQGVLFGIYS